MAGASPGINLGTLIGSTNPAISNIYTYTASDLTLAPATSYFIVLSAQTPVATGAYAWSIENSPPPSSIGGWSGGYYVLTPDNAPSWLPAYSAPEFALIATPTPEPEAFGLLGLTGSLLLIRREISRSMMLS